MHILKQAFIRLKSKNGFDSASVLSFSTLFAIVPTLTLMFSVFSLSPYFADLQQHLEGFLFEQLLPKNYELVNQYIQQFIVSAQKLKGISLLFLLLATIFLFREVNNRINSIWSVRKKRHFGIDLLIYILVLILGPLFLAGSLFVSSYLSASEVFVFIPMGGIFISSLPIILSAIGLSLMYYFIPGEKIVFKFAIQAGFIAAFFLEILKSILLIYIQFFPLYEVIYGALSMLLLFMLWVYFSWALILFGASITYILNQEN
ncbi:Inner membrane protein YihY, formerly thought to be RNase BN [uncultured Candidatus Thioglobus sp.]|nr:Inner membrane protein YihY, formerly thought to be RNase BN [uncultured Candidatus Thioglobus sp.]